MKLFSSLNLALVILLSSGAVAQAEPFTYGPDTCDFKITYPEKPFIEEKCVGEDKKECTEVVTYTKVISVDSSVNVRITCSEKPAKELERYSLEVMQETLKQMLAEANLSSDAIETSDENGIKSAAAVSAGTRADRDIIYTGQIWVGKKSLFTLEADMTGAQHDEADKLFSEILKSMLPKDSQPKAKADKPKTDKPATDKKEE